MINIRLNNILSKQSGFATLGVTVVVLLSMTIVSFFTAGTVVIEQKITTNVSSARQTFNAAQAGLDYGITYLSKNRSTVTDGMVVTGSLPNNSTYSVVYQFQGGTNVLVKIVSTATSADGTVTRVIEQLVKNLTPSIPALPLTSKGDVDLVDDSTITNLEGSNTIIMGGDDMEIDDNGQTVLAGGTSSTESSIEADIELNNAALAGKTADQLAIDVLGISVSSLAATASITATNSGITNYNSLLGGVTGATISIIQTGGDAKLTSTTVVGSSANPVNIVVDGNLTIEGNVIIYGNLIVTGKITIKNNVQVYGLVFVLKNDKKVELLGSAKVFGAVVSIGEVVLEDSASLTYDSSILTSAMSTISSYGKVSGSWKEVSPSP